MGQKVLGLNSVPTLLISCLTLPTMPLNQHRSSLCLSQCCFWCGKSWRSYFLSIIRITGVTLAGSKFKHYSRFVVIGNHKSTLLPLLRMFSGDQFWSTSLFTCSTWITLFHDTNLNVLFVPPSHFIILQFKFSSWLCLRVIKASPSIHNHFLHNHFPSTYYCLFLSTFLIDMLEIHKWLIWLYFAVICYISSNN